jgi:Uma2 family endonuclease
MMTTMAVMPREAKEWTVDDLDLVPDDGLQYELLDGLLLVTPAPVTQHQRATARLHLLLAGACPPLGMEVFFAPLDWRPDERTSLQPDLLVVRDEDIEPKNIRKPLILAVEVLSPSTRRKDLIYKRSKYEECGVLSYWVVDPDEPSIVVHELVDGRYLETGRASGSAELAVELPFPLTVMPSALVNR